MPYSGGCLCGEVLYEIDRKHLNAMHCYCGVCRKAYGTAFSTHVILPPDQLRWVRKGCGLDSYECPPGSHREFCSGCGTRLLVHGGAGDGTFAIPAGTLDGDPSLTIIGHMYTRELVSWHKISDDLPQYEQWPPGFGPSRFR